MAGIQNFVYFQDDFLGTGSLAAAGQGSPWAITDTSSAGTPTYTVGGINGEATLAMDTQAEAQNVCIDFGDDLNFDIDLLDHVEFRIKTGQAAVDATTDITFGMTSARNDTIDTIAHAAIFRVTGAGSTTNLVVETDDATTNNDDVATGTTLINAYKKCRISFAAGTNDVRFYVDGSRVAAATTFDMSGYTAGLQPMIQLQKTSDANANSVVCDYVSVVSRRA